MPVTRTIRHALIALLLVLGVIGTSALPAQAAAGSIVGTVRDIDGHPVEGIGVSAYSWSSGWQDVGTYEQTNSSGAYTIGALPAGPYILFFSDNSGSGTYQQVWSNGKATRPVDSSSAGVITVSAGVASTHDQTMPDGPTAQLDGRVQRADTHEPLDGVVVEARAAGDPTGDVVSTAITYGGEYRLYVSPGHWDLTFSHLSDDFATGALLDVVTTKNTTTGLPLVELAPGTGFDTITGSVQVSNPSGASASGITVKLWRVLGTPLTNTADLRAVGITNTAADGTYSFTQLVPGKRYVVEVDEPGYTNTWLGNVVDDWERSTIVTPTSASTTVAPISVERRTTILGRVSDSVGDASGVGINVYKWDGSSFTESTSDYGYTDDQGKYVIDLSAPGTYALHADTSGSETLGRDRWFGTTTRPTAPSGPGTFAVGSREIVRADTTLDDDTTIRGVVKDSASPNGVARVYVSAAQWDGSGWVFTSHGGTTDASGHYAFKVVEGAGRWAVSFQPPSTSPAADQWLGGTFRQPDPTQLGATNSVVTTDGQATIAPTVTLRDAPTIRGQVVSDTGEPIPAARVRGFVWSYDQYSGTGSWYASYSAVADETGHYVLRAAPGEKVTVRAAKAGYYRSFLGGTSVTPTSPVLSGSGTNAVLVPEDTVAAPTIALKPLPTTTGSLHGTVSGPDAPLAAVNVVACPVLAGPPCQQTRPSSSGTWQLPTLVTGDWKLDFWPDASQSFFPGSKRVTVVSAQDTAVDIALAAPAKLPDNASVTQGGVTQTRGVPTVYYSDPISIRIPGPAGVSNPTYSVRLSDGGPVINGSLSYQDGAYVATIAPFAPRHGDATITSNIPAASGGGTVAFDLYIDPSGTVVDQYGQLVQNATAELQRSDTQNGTYSKVADGSTIMSPSNRTNPMSTGESGVFHWDVTPGWYRVVVSKAGCPMKDPNPAGMQVPPERVDLVIDLVCTTAPSPTRQPTITGTAASGQTLHVTAGQWAGTWDAPSYQWTRDGNDIAGATGASYALTDADAGRSVTVRQTQSRGTNQPVSATAAPVPVSLLAAPTTSRLVITGARSIGSIVTASASWSTPSTVSYQWKRGGSSIAGATGATYRLVPADAGKVLTVVATAAAPSHQSGTATSAGFAVSRASSTGATRMYAAKIKRTQRGLALISFRVSGLVPTGRVTTIIDNKYKVLSTMYVGNRGNLRVYLPKLKKGLHSVRAVYAGNAQVLPASTRSTYVRVK